MEFVAHKKIRDFSIDGQIYDEADLPRLKLEYENIVEHYMRVKGYIPHLDLDPSFTVSYNGHSFDFKITWYGIYLGKAKAKCYTGVIGNKLVPMTPMIPNKLMKSYRSAESQLDQS
jgi:hypothetical protein